MVPCLTLETCSFQVTTSMQMICSLMFVVPSIYVSNKFTSFHIKLPNHNFEDSVSVEISGQKQSKILVTCLYRSGSPQKALQKDDEMYRLMRTIPAAPGYTMNVIIGDFNLNKILWSTDLELPASLYEDSVEHKFVEMLETP